MNLCEAVPGTFAENGLAMILSKSDVTPEALAAEDRDIARRFDVAHIDNLQYFPQYFQLETTRLCNAHCPFCPADVWNKSTPFMSDELFKKLADEIIEYRDAVKFLNIQRAGEPLLDKKLYERVRYLKDGGIKFIALATNASALNEQNARKLLEAGIDEVMLSIDSVEKERYEQLRIGLKYEQVIANIRGFFNLRDEIRPQCIIRVRGVSFHDTSKQEDRDDIEAWERFWGDLKKPHDRIYMKRAHTWGNQKIVEGHSPEYDWVYHACVIPFSTMHITAMGHVALCGQDYDATINFGDLNRETIVEVWRGESINAMRKLHRSGERNQVSLCQGCRLWDEEFSLEREKEAFVGPATPTKKTGTFDLTGIRRAPTRIA
jgi:wyosine [tRNA(Phe)-imidazoG37] synthetase (radical SAM superfamily)